METCPGQGVVKEKFPHSRKPSHRHVCGEFWNFSESRSVMSDSLWPHGLYNPRNSPGQNTGVGSLSLFQGIFPTLGSNPGLPHRSQILYQMSHPRILEWAAGNLRGQCNREGKKNPQWESQFLGRLIISPWSLRRRKGYEALKEQTGVGNFQVGGKGKLLFSIFP